MPLKWLDLVFVAIATWSFHHVGRLRNIQLMVPTYILMCPCTAAICSVISHHVSELSAESANSWLFVCLFDCLFVSLTACLHSHINLCNQCVFTREESAYIQVFVLSFCSPRISTRWVFTKIQPQQSPDGAVGTSYPSLFVGTFCYPKWMVHVTGHCIYIYPNIPLYTRDLSADSSCKRRALVGCFPKDGVDDHQVS